LWWVSLRSTHPTFYWFNINRLAEDTILSTAIPEQTEVFHWHFDTFDIPKGAKVLAESLVGWANVFLFAHHSIV
jgi:GMP synthase-like glutamine amidotransferase